MATIKSFTSTGQSNKLLELGLDPESADMIYTMVNGRCTPFIRVETIDELYEDDVLCWSLGALLEAMPKHIFSGDRIKNYTPVLYIGEKNVVLYQYMNEFLHIEHADTSIEAAYSMVVWLLENGYIKQK